MSLEDVVKTVADWVSTFTQTLSKGCLKSFRSRARDIPSLMFSRGLAYALVYVASRSSADAFKAALEAIERKSKECKDLGEIAEKYGEEKCGYALYGALLAYAMKVYGTVKEGSKDPFRELVETALKDPTVSAIALEIAEWIKRFAEAYIKEEAY